MDSNTIILGEFNTPFTLMDRSPRQKINTETGFKWHIRPDGLYKAFRMKAAENELFSNVHATVSRIDHMLDYKASLGKFKKTEIISSIFPTTTL